jgi:hypothetical protein
MATQDLFKQAIADAKSIREAAIANAKLALEESITPELKELLAAKLQEMEEEVEEEVVAETSHEEEVEETYNEEVEEEVEEVVAEEEAEEDAEDDSEESEDEAEEEEAEGEEPAGDEEVADSDLTVDDLKDMIRDIISQEMGEEGAEIDSEEEAEDMMDVGAEELPMEDEEEIDINELLAELSEELDEEVDEEANDMDKQGNQDDLEDNDEANVEVNEELEEALAQVEELKAQLQETNLLNAKLLYVNKVFKGNNLTESQKANVIATFDKAETVKEVKLVFETVAESFTTKKEVVKESRGFASAAVGNAPSKPEVITEVSSQVMRMQKLAGIIK